MGKVLTPPRARHKGRQPLIECAKHDFKILERVAMILGRLQRKFNFYGGVRMGGRKFCG